MNIKQSTMGLMKSGITMLLASLLLSSNFKIGNAAPGKFDPNTDILIDNFQDAKEGGDPYSGGRYWYSFGGLSIESTNHSLQITGSDLKEWSGFGIAPEASGDNGEIINAKNKSLLCVEYSGTSPILEIYDLKSHKTEHRGTKSTAWITFALPEVAKNNNIAKIQFKYPPRTINTTISKLYFTD